MISTKSAWQLLSVRPPPRVLSRRLLDPKFLPSPVLRARLLDKRCFSGKTNENDERNPDFDEDAIRDIFRRRVDGTDQGEDVKLEDLIDDNFQVNLFDQDRGGKMRRKAANEDDGPDEDDAELSELLADDEDDKQLSMNLRRAHSMSQEEIDRFFPSEQLREDSDLDIALAKEFDLSQYHIGSTETLPVQAQVNLEKLNGALDEARFKPRSNKARRAVWVWYTRCKREVPQFLKLIPAAAWDLLWVTQSANLVKNAARLDHLRVLTEDKASVGWELSLKEQLVKIEALYVDGQKAGALDEWHQLDAGDVSLDVSFLQLGARMLALDGQYNEAEILIRRAFDANKETSPRLILVLIRALCSSDEITDVHRAYAWYEELRARLGGSMSMTDYDKVVLAFLGAGHSRHALAVFRDMMATGDGVATTPVKADYSWQKLAGSLPVYKNARGADEINKVALQTLQMLPPRFRNKFFFGSWIKKLIGENELSAAAQVVELMYESGIRPDAKYLNGLIGAWLRQDDHESHARAENLAWLMIRKRITAIKTRDRNASLPTANELLDSKSVMAQPAPLFVERSVPEGTIETWCLMGDYYLHRSTNDQIRQLRDLLDEARIPMNAVFMNLLLGAELRAHGHRRTWARFEVMTRKTQPSFDSWIFLWDCLKYHLDTVKNPDMDGFPMPRELFKLMMEWFNGLTDQQKVRELSGFDIQAYHTILRGFSYNRDINGIFVAMQALHVMWGAVPDDRVGTLLVTRVARLEVPKYKSVRAGYVQRLAKARAAEQNVDKAVKLLRAIKANRDKRYADAGVNLTDHGEGALLVESHRVLLTFLYTVLRQREGAHSISTVSRLMGVDDFDVDEAMSLLV